MDPPGGSNFVHENSENEGFSHPGGTGQKRGLPQTMHDYEHPNHGCEVYENRCISDITPDFQKELDPQSWSEGNIYINKNYSLNTRQYQDGNSNNAGNTFDPSVHFSTPEKSLAPIPPVLYGPQRPSHLALEDRQHYLFNRLIPTTVDDSNWSSRATNGLEKTPEESHQPICYYGNLEAGYPILENDSLTEGVGGCGVQVGDNPHNLTSQRRSRRPFSEDRKQEVKEVRKRKACIRCQYLKITVSPINVDYWGIEIMKLRW